MASWLNHWSSTPLEQGSFNKMICHPSGFVLTVTDSDSAKPSIRMLYFKPKMNSCICYPWNMRQKKAGHQSKVSTCSALLFPAQKDVLRQRLWGSLWPRGEPQSGMGFVFHLFSQGQGIERYTTRICPFYHFKLYNLLWKPLWLWFQKTFFEKTLSLWLSKPSLACIGGSKYF